MIWSELTTDKIRVKAAIAAMQSLMLNPTFSEKEVAERAVKQADALIEELKKKDNGSSEY